MIGVVYTGETLQELHSEIRSLLERRMQRSDIKVFIESHDVWKLAQESGIAVPNAMLCDSIFGCEITTVEKEREKRNKD